MRDSLIYEYAREKMMENLFADLDEIVTRGHLSEEDLTKIKTYMEDFKDLDWNIHYYKSKEAEEKEDA